MLYYTDEQNTTVINVAMCQSKEIIENQYDIYSIHS